MPRVRVPLRPPSNCQVSPLRLAFLLLDGELKAPAVQLGRPAPTVLEPIGRSVSLRAAPPVGNAARRSALPIERSPARRLSPSSGNAARGSPSPSSGNARGSPSPSSAAPPVGPSRRALGAFGDLEITGQKCRERSLVRIFCKTRSFSQSFPSSPDFASKKCALNSAKMGAGPSVRPSICARPCSRA